MNQVEMAKKLGMSDRNLRDVLNTLGMDHKTHSFDEILLAYIEHLRSMAAGRTPTGINEEKVIAETRKANAAAYKMERELALDEGLLLHSDQVKACMSEWIARVKGEFEGAIFGLVESVESQHSVKIDHDYVSKLAAATLRAASDYRYQPVKSG